MAVCFGLHFLLAIIASLRATLSIFAQTQTVFPDPLRGVWQTTGEAAASAMGQKLDPSNPVRNSIAIYLQAAGSEAGYGFFAPNVPDSFTLLFEIHFADGRVVYDLPHVMSASDGLRFNGLLDQMSMITYEPLRNTIFKILTYSIWQSYPEATRIRAIFTTAILPSIAEFRAGREISHQVLFDYDLSFAHEPKESQH